MAETYGFRLSDQDQQLFTAWSRQDPPDAWEMKRNGRIKAIQGHGNRFIEDYAALFGRSIPSGAATTPASAAEKVVPARSAQTPGATTPKWTCGSKTRCSQMRSCEEAQFFLTECGVTSLDGDGDRIPCAALCR